MSKNVPLIRSSIAIACILGIFVLWTKLAPFLLATYSFGPHGDCFLWNQGLVTLFAGSDSLIGLSYFFISGALSYFVYKIHRDLPFSWVFLAFGIFIVACGSTHFLDVWTIWVPIYVLSGTLRFITAIASVATAVILPFVLPNVTALIVAAKVSEERKQQLVKANHELETKNRELLNQQSQLTATNIALEEANRVRSQFLATMSHELRTPLTSIVGFSEMLLEDAVLVGLDQQQQANLGRILKNGEHLQNMINNVLDISKIEAGCMQLSYEDVNVKELVVAVADEIQSLASARNLVLKVELDEEIDKLETHPTKLRQILMNLLSNALNFTEQGEVKLSAHPVFLSDMETEGIAFVVQDTGIGMSPETQAHIFEAFYQADMSYTRKVGGTGLGLSIVKQLTVLLNGTVEVISTLGQGSTFTVKLPHKAIHSSNFPRLHSQM